MLYVTVQTLENSQDFFCEIQNNNYIFFCQAHVLGGEQHTTCFVGICSETTCFVGEFVWGDGFFVLVFRKTRLKRVFAFPVSLSFGFGSTKLVVSLMEEVSFCNARLDGFFVKGKSILRSYYVFCCPCAKEKLEKVFRLFYTKVCVNEYRRQQKLPRLQWNFTSNK